MAPIRSLLTLGSGSEKFKGRVQVAFGAVFGHASHDLMRFFGSRRHFAAVEIDGERYVAFAG